MKDPLVKWGAAVAALTTILAIAAILALAILGVNRNLALIAGVVVGAGLAAPLATLWVRPWQN